jgi:hypothetical protein
MSDAYVLPMAVAAGLTALMFVPLFYVMRMAWREYRSDRAIAKLGQIAGDR